MTTLAEFNEFIDKILADSEPEPEEYYLPSRGVRLLMLAAEIESIAWSPVSIWEAGEIRGKARLEAYKLIVEAPHD